jgi:hypothetical protein
VEKSLKTSTTWRPRREEEYYWSAEKGERAEFRKWRGMVEEENYTQTKCGYMYPLRWDMKERQEQISKDI